MTYYVITEGRNQLTLFLVDRTKTKKQWWTHDLGLAMSFYKESTAKIQARKLKYKNPQVVNSDDSYEYGSCQNKWSVINTPIGLFWISQNQGKIFHYSNKLEDITNYNMKWWFEEFLPYKIL